jgi:ABC-type cobalamin/Fe3+-siderophores transport system ATPase subunit
MSTLELSGIEASYPGRSSAEPVLRGVDLRLEAGELVALIGPNGAGKSTLLRTAGGVLRPSAGRALLHDRDMTKLKPRDIARQIAVVPRTGRCPQD